MNPLVELQAYGQSFWYDNIQRKLLRDGTLRAMISIDGLRGMTSNPSIFQKAIGSSDDYDEQMRALAAEASGARAIYEALALADIQAACDLFASVYQASNGGDGYVSLEVSPHLAQDTAKTVAEARRLFAAVNRPNVMIKVPATAAGIPAIRQLISDGINVNITLMFSMKHYEAVAGAYMEGLAQLLESGKKPEKVASVASFFVSRVDTAVDRELATLNDGKANGLMGKAAIANSRLVYQRYKEIFHGDRFDLLRKHGAAPQRLLWASTSTKNPAYPDTLYIDELIGSETVNTMPPDTIDAFRHHGRVSNSLEEGIAEARKVMEDLAGLQIDLDRVTEQLQEDGVTAFANSYDALIEAIVIKNASLAMS
jgi:transaldolase